MGPGTGVGIREGGHKCTNTHTVCTHINNNIKQAIKTINNIKTTTYTVMYVIYTYTDIR